MKPTTEKQIEVTNERDDLNACIKEYYSFLEEHRVKSELIEDIIRNLGEINKEIKITQEIIDNPVIPKMRNIADVDAYMNDFGAPHKRLELLLEAQKLLVNQIGHAKTESNRYIELAADIKKDAWFKLAKLLIKPIQNQLNQTILAVGLSGKELIAFLLTENSNSDMSSLSEKLTSEYGMPK